jgi:hypothetical protein
MRERTLFLHGFSKAWAMTGFRVGYCCAPPELIEAMMTIHQYTMLCAPILSQAAALEALRKADVDVGEMRKRYRRNRNYISQSFTEMAIPCPRPGGAFYAFCQAEELGLTLNPEDFRTLMDVGMRIKRAVMASHPIHHPFESDLGFLYGTIIVGEAQEADHHSRNVCIFADGEVDRSPTGTGVSARAALHFARGELEVGEPFTVESILGTTFTGQVVETTRFGSFDAVVPQVSGTSYIVGRNELLIDPNDPLQHGFILR